MTPENWTWNNGIGFLPLGRKPVPYDKKYFKTYVLLARLPSGVLINRIRRNMVENWVSSDKIILDVGIGAGAFVSDMRSHHWKIYGTDVNKVGIQWLKENKLWHSPTSSPSPDVLTFWDVLEHIPDPGKVFQQYLPEWIFASMPIYRDENHVFTSRHFKPGEHCWYFTEEGFRRFMHDLYFQCVEVNQKETQLANRDSVYSFVFRRIL